MADITIVNGVYKPTYNWGAPSCRGPHFLVRLPISKFGVAIPILSIGCSSPLERSVALWLKFTGLLPFNCNTFRGKMIWVWFFLLRFPKSWGQLQIIQSPCLSIEQPWWRLGTPISLRTPPIWAAKVHGHGKFVVEGVSSDRPPMINNWV